MERVCRSLALERDSLALLDGSSDVGGEVVPLAAAMVGVVVEDKILEPPAQGRLGGRDPDQNIYLI